MTDRLRIENNYAVESMQPWKAVLNCYHSKLLTKGIVLEIEAGLEGKRHELGSMALRRDEVLQLAQRLIKLARDLP